MQSNSGSSVYDSVASWFILESRYEQRMVDEAKKALEKAEALKKTDQKLRLCDMRSILEHLWQGYKAGDIDKEQQPGR